MLRLGLIALSLPLVVDFFEDTLLVILRFFAVVDLVLRLPTHKQHHAHTFSCHTHHHPRPQYSHAQIH